jgi:hypothetical protein
MVYAKYLSKDRNCSQLSTVHNLGIGVGYPSPFKNGNARAPLLQRQPQSSRNLLEHYFALQPGEWVPNNPQLHKIGGLPK